MAAVFSALADPTRRRVLRLLAEEGPDTATGLAAELPVSRQAVSKHLAALAEAGLVEAETAGRERRYRVTPRPLGDAVTWMAGLGSEWDDRLEALRAVLVERRSGTSGGRAG
ncbi:MAG: winged helix-turn-helix transcriptional regulator [Actinobacteria bacterium]|nr:winged helix-turn-helix transcriptional regulator [Actinomycetota bacterium]